MAAPQWTGGKCKSVQQAKAFFRHNDKDRRMEANHANVHIDKTKTKDNFTYRGLTYKQLCEAFDKKLESVDMGRESSGKNARVVLQSVLLYPPAQLPPHLVRAWLMDAGRVLEDRYGDNLLEIQYDMDEQHEYIDPETHEKRLSQHHGHARLFPSVDGKLNGKAFSSRAEIKALNHALDMMSLQKYGIPMMDGTKRKGGKSVEALKAASLRAEVEQLEERAETIIADAMNQATEIVTDAALNASATRREADQDRAEAKRLRGAAWFDAQEAQAEREDADEYARTTRRRADQDADQIRARADRDAQATREAAERDKAQAARDVQAMREQLAVMQLERDRAQAERDKAKADAQDARDWVGELWNAHKQVQATLQGDFHALQVREARAGVQSLLEASGAVVRPLMAQRVNVPPTVKPGPVAGSVMAALRRQLAAMDGNPGPTSVEGPTL